MPRKIKINKGDSWIKIANDNNLSLNDLLYWNGIDPMSREALPRINPGQEIYISDPYRLPAASTVAQAPQNYTDYGEAGKQLINNYALAVQQGAINLNNVPEAYRTAVYQRGITNATNKAANTTLKVGLNLGAFLLDPIGYTLSTVGQKGIAYTTDRASGRNEYEIEDVLGYTPIKGRQYASEHPAEAALIDVGAGIASGGLLRNLPNFIRGLGQNWRAMMQNAVASTGQQRQTMMYPGKDTFGTVYTSATKGSGKTGTVRAGRVGGYSPNTSIKGAFNNQSSGNATTWVSPDKTIPMLPLTPIPFNPVIGPINWMNRRDPKVVVNNPEQHIYEQQSFNRWQLPMPAGGVMGEFKPGTGNFVLTGHAPIGNTVNQQALTNESIRVYNNDYAPRISTYVKGNIEGTPSNIHSGLGIIWGSENPGNLIINNTKYKLQNGGIIKLQNGFLNTWQKAYNSKFGKGLRDFMFGKDKDLSDEEYLEKYGYNKPVGGIGVLGALVAPEWEGLEIPEITAQHIGNQGKVLRWFESGNSKMLKVPVKETSKKVSNWQRFLKLSQQEQDDFVRRWNGESFKGYATLKGDKQALSRFRSWINSRK